MAYNNTIPKATDQLKNSQSDILNNFIAIKQLVDINHEGAAPTTAANEVGLYSAVGAYSAASELVFRRESNGTSIPFTEGLNADNGWARLGNNLLVKWGNVTIAGAAGGTSSRTDTIAFPVGATIPAFTTAIYQIFLTPRSAALIDFGFLYEVNTTTTLTNLKINIYTNSALGGWNSTDLAWIALGV